MRAFRIAVFIAIMSFAVSTVNVALQAPALPQVEAPSPPNVQYLTTNETGLWGSLTSTASLLFEYVKLGWEIVRGALLLGSTFQTLSPLPIPEPMVAMLNAISAFSISIAVYQLFRGMYVGE